MPGVIPAEDDSVLDPAQEEIISYPRKTNNQDRRVFYPKEGNDVLVLYIEVAPDKRSSVRSAIRAIADADCEKARFLKRYRVAPVDGKLAAVQLRMQVHNDINLGG